MKRTLPILLSVLLLCVSVAVLFRMPAEQRRAVLPAKVAKQVEAYLGDAPAKVAIFTPDTPQAVTEAMPTVSAEAAKMPELRIAAIRNGVRYGWIQLPRGARVELLRREGDWMIIRYEGTHVRVHRAVAEAGVITPYSRQRRAMASL